MFFEVGEEFYADLEHAAVVFGLDGFGALRVLAEKYLLPKRMPHTHHRSKIPTLRRMTYQLPIHDKIQVGAYRQRLTVDILPRFQFVEEAIVHDVFETERRQLGKERVPETQMPHCHLKLRIPAYTLPFVLFD